LFITCTHIVRTHQQERYSPKPTLLDRKLGSQHNMNDPGLDEPAQEAAQDVENNIQAEDDQAEQEEREYLDPRYVSQ
jgi:hypothetical protein